MEGETIEGFPGALVVKSPPANAGDITKRYEFHLWVGKIPLGGHSNPLQHSCLENPRDRGAWWATVHRVAESDTTEMT